MMKDKEEELALFLEMRKREKERNTLLLQNSPEFDSRVASKLCTSPMFSITSSAEAQKTIVDDFLNSENDKNDYDWLVTPPSTPTFPSLEIESEKTVTSRIGSPKARPTALKSRLANCQPEPAARSNLASRQSSSSLGLNPSSAAVCRPSSSGGLGSRPATPIGRSTMTLASKPTINTASKSMTTASKSMLTTVSKPTSANMSKLSRSSTPTSRTTLPSSQPKVPARSSPSLLRTTARPSTSTGRSTLPASKTTSRTAIPTHAAGNLSAATNPGKSTSSVTKSGSTTVTNPVPLRASSPTVRPRPWNPSEMPGFSLDAPPNLRTCLPDRPLSAARGRPGKPTARSSSVEPAVHGRVRRQSCSPSQSRPPNGIIRSSGSSLPAVNRSYAKAKDNVSPVLVGTKTVERVVNMRKLVSPRQDGKHSPHSNLSGKSSSPDSLGFGRTLSKKSLDMAIRHMDVRQRVRGNLRPSMTNRPASSMYSVRSAPTPKRTVSVSDSLLLTSSGNTSSEASVNNNGLCVDGSELEDDVNSYKGGQSSATVQDR
ncbi:uncharacterized protein LOC127797513 [Diospyros lotus]|uniref:uncharacterized protein LOC127797513 n=1 Tax=Diospyros lotus TaxID=55363 RepID=UPI002255FD71|nr:uncharacterized protein LOC127797513 [Diospyros lotus]